MSGEILAGPIPGGPPEIGPMAPPQPEMAAELGVMPGPELSSTPVSPTEVMNEALTNDYYALQERLLNGSGPTQQELEIGVFVEEIQPQVREAILSMRQKGYDNGNVTLAGFAGENNELQGMDLFTPLSQVEATLLENNGFIVEPNHLSFHPQDPTDLDGIKSTWDLLASILPDRGLPVGPAMFGNAVAFRRAAEDGTLLNHYMPHGVLDTIGTKYTKERDPLAGRELFLSPDAMSATRELTFIDQYHELKSRLSSNPVPSVEEWNAGAYKEEIEPQVRDAAMAMRAKGYNTGSSGFWGPDHADQAMDIATPIDDESKARLAAHNIKVTDTGIQFSPEHPTNLDRVKATWDMIADILPDLGKHADPAQSERAGVFRYATQNSNFDAYLEGWVWRTGALNGRMMPLTVTMINEGRSFGPDVYEPARLADATYQEMVGASTR